MELYYYTTTDTLQFILTKGDIFATNIRYMNDSEEYTNGLIELKKLANNRQKIEKWLSGNHRTDITYQDIARKFTKEQLDHNMEVMEFYSISFCKKNDLLSQWEVYAKESGVSVKMKFDKPLYHFSAKSMEKTRKGEEPKLAEWDLLPKDVYYFTYDSMVNAQQKRQYENTAFEILDQLYPVEVKDFEENTNQRWRYISTYVKRYDFYQESESRLVFEPSAAVYRPLVEYRCDKKVLKPYLDIVCKDGWPVSEIMIGPGFNQDVVYNSVVHFLEHKTDLKNGIATPEDFVQRVLDYFHPYEKWLMAFDAYCELLALCSEQDKLAKMDLNTVRINFTQKVREVCRAVCLKDKRSNLAKYLLSHPFTKSGIVASKSSIPYIF